MKKRRQLLSAQRLRSADQLPKSAGRHTLAQCRLWRVDGCRGKIFGRRGPLRFVDERPIRARDHHVGFSASAQLATDRIELPEDLPLPGKISSRMNPLERHRSLAREHDRARSFAHDHASRSRREGLDRRRRPQQAPFPIRVAEQPVRFLCANHQTAIQLWVRHQVFRHLQGENPDRAVADQSITRARDPEDRREVTGRRVKNRFRKKQRTRGRRARVHDVVIEAPGVNDPAVRDREN